MLRPFHCISSVVSLRRPRLSRILVGCHYTLVSFTCLYFSIYHTLNSNGSLCATFPECCMLSSYCSSNFPQQHLLLISPRTLRVVLCITADYVLSLYWEVTQLSLDFPMQIGHPNVITIPSPVSPTSSVSEPSHGAPRNNQSSPSQALRLNMSHSLMPQRTSFESISYSKNLYSSIPFPYQQFSTVTIKALSAYPRMLPSMAVPSTLTSTSTSSAKPSPPTASS